MVAREHFNLWWLLLYGDSVGWDILLFTDQFELRWTNTQWLSVGILPVPGPEQWWLVMLLTARGQLRMPTLHPYEDD